MSTEMVIQSKRYPTAQPFFQEFFLFLLRVFALHLPEVRGMSSRDFRLFLVFVLGTLVVMVRSDDDDDKHKHWIPEKIHIGVVRHFSKHDSEPNCTV